MTGRWDVRLAFFACFPTRGAGTPLSAEPTISLPKTRPVRDGTMGRWDDGTMGRETGLRLLSHARHRHTVQRRPADGGSFSVAARWDAGHVGMTSPSQLSPSYILAEGRTWASWPNAVAGARARNCTWW
ncbi:uncharacterized protein LY79DRAFT_35382 [Colletotrichum navitas]|uniref:Uncharacterized protein n=1 Tax=Colletotrichum navitas TaxID=681940 RepID=A0AAD8Q7Z1_9PEZI|nr:uncharacterized protein LY79DRAFT_35382 [Colletotrichum navitas]KAK1596906.1 hypothetical protein LY79DRAFT_35382 [Colletotrichum navitas]